MTTTAKAEKKKKTETLVSTRLDDDLIKSFDEEVESIRKEFEGFSRAALLKKILKERYESDKGGH